MSERLEHYRRAAERLQCLQTLTAALAQAQTYDCVADVIIDQALPALGAEVGVLAILSEDGQTLRNVGFKGVASETGEAWRVYSVHSPVPVAEAVLRRKPIIVSTVQERDARYPVLAAVHGVAQGGAVTAFPLFAAGRLLGVLGLCYKTSRDFGDDEVALLKTLADQCAFAVERAGLRELSEREIEERRRSEAQLAEASRRKDEFIAMLAHELRNPLAPIRNAADTLKLMNPDERQRERLVDIIVRQSAHMTRLIDDLLDASRITRGRLQLQRAAVCFRELVSSTLADERALFEQAGLTLTSCIPEGPLWVDVDQTRIVQVLTNILHNSLKFTEPAGAVHVDVTTGGEAVRVSVRDTGPGMTPFILGRAFEPFTQAEQHLSRTRGGLGLGLAVVKTLVEMHGGGVSAASEGPGRGSTVSFWLPATLKGHVTEVQTAQKSEALPLRILVIEDNEDAAEALSLMLSLRGHEVKLAWDGAEGLRLAATFAPDVVISDIGLPGDTDGYQVARALKAGADVRRRPHIIALSGYGQEDDKRQAFEAGFDAHLTKPIDIAALAELLARVTATKAPAAQDPPPR